MTTTKKVDTRGLSCPQPVMLAHQAIGELETGAVEILADSATAQENISRLARNSGWEIMVEIQADGSYLMVLKK